MPVFPSLGNHDAPTPGDWHKPADYISERVRNANGILTYYGRGSYIWRWGQFVFVQLGLWAGDDEIARENDTRVDEAKLTWLRDWLAANVGDSGLGILIFQHYAFGVSDRWWASWAQERENDILCRRQNSSQPCTPYNVIGISAGHDHLRANDRIGAGNNPKGVPVWFDQYRMPDVGKNSNGQYGFAIVWLYRNRMTIDTRNGNSGNWGHDEKTFSLGSGAAP